MLLPLLTCAALAAAQPAPPVLDDTPGVVVISSDAALSFAWTLPDAERWLSPDDSRDPVLARFQTTIAARLSTNPQALLRRQRALFLKNGLPTAMLDWVLAHPRQVGPMNRLQARLFAIHWRDEKPLNREFQAFVLRRGPALRVYYTGSDERSGWPRSAEVKALLGRDLAAGWRLYAHLHNHPFFFENPAGDIAGTTAPSAADAQMYRELAVWGRLERAWIVNGFDALTLLARDFPRLP
jgi:hypothetical protein